MVRAQFSKLDSADVRARLLALPTLFAYESQLGLPSRLGRITEIQTRNETIRIKYNINDAFTPVGHDIFEQFEWELDIRKWELNRTHWAVKDADLLTILNPPPTPVGADVSHRYAIGEKIGHGAYAETYSAHDSHLGRAVAVKFFSTERTPDFVLREARATVDIHSDHVVTIFDVAALPHPSNGTVTDCVIMELIDGRTLEAAFADGGLTSEACRSVANQLVDALLEIRGKNRFHQDIHIGNILLRAADGKVVIIDALSSGPQTRYRSRLRLENHDLRCIVYTILEMIEACLPELDIHSANRRISSALDPLELRRAVQATFDGELASVTPSHTSSLSEGVVRRLIAERRLPHLEVVATSSQRSGDPRRLNFHARVSLIAGEPPVSAESITPIRGNERLSALPSSKHDQFWIMVDFPPGVDKQLVRFDIICTTLDGYVIRYSFEATTAYQRASLSKAELRAISCDDTKAVRIS